MKGRPVDQLVFEQIFTPKGPRHTDPQNFGALLQRHLILEVRQEVHAFYGHLETQEAKYPGLDYTHPTHRIRLSRWPWHRRLFRAFDALGLTAAEIANLTKWEGTKWAKERFEQDQGITIRDTTADDFPAYVEPEDRVSVTVTAATATATPMGTPTMTPTMGTALPMASLLMTQRRHQHHSSHSSRRQQEGAAAAAAAAAVTRPQRREVPASAAAAAAASTTSSPAADSAMDEDSDDGELESVGMALNERLRARVALRDASGDTSVPLDEEWETWLKNAIESGELPDVTDEIAAGGGAAYWFNFDDIWPPSAAEAARAGRWHEFSPFLRDMIRAGVRHSQREFLMERQQRLEREQAQLALAREASTGTGSNNNNSNNNNGGSSSTRPAQTQTQTTQTQTQTGTTQTENSSSSSPSSSAAAASQAGASSADLPSDLPSVDYVRALSRNGGGVRMIAEFIENQDRLRRGATQADMRVQHTAQPGA